MRLSLPIKKIVYILFALFFIGSSFNVFAIMLPRGHIDMQGSIINAACTIDMKSKYQLINVDMIPFTHLSQGLTTPDVNFGIKLIDCYLNSERSNIPSGSVFNITFDGQRVREGGFKLQGAVRGVFIKLLRTDGAAIIPGEPITASYLDAEEIQLDFIIRFIKNHENLLPGYFKTTLRFKMDYY